MSRSGSDPRTGRGFTLLELLIVTSIILILLSSLVAATMYARRAAKKAATGRLIRLQLKPAMATYFLRHQDYPPDGYDSKVEVYGERIQGSQCLLYYLATPQPKRTRRADGTIRTVMEEPILEDLQSGDLTFPIREIEEREEIPELVDAFGGGVFYDRVTHLKEYTMPLTRENHPDPRPPDAPKLTMGKFQIWSLGIDGLEKEGDPTNDITSWEE